MKLNRMWTGGFKTPALACVLGLACAAGHAADRLKVGVLTSLSGAGAAIGVDIRDSFQLAVKHAGGKLGGLPTDIIVADDQMSPDGAKQTADRMIKRDKVDLMTGVVLSNVMLAVAPQVFQSRTYYISANSGPSQLAGAQCNPYFFNVAWQNDNLHEAVGKVVTDRGLKKVALIAQNYPGGRDAIAGFKRYYKGEVAIELYPPLGQLDFAAELSKMRASGADAVYVFLPGSFGVNFFKQMAAAGLNKEIKVFAAGFSTDQDILSAAGDVMLGIFNSSHWAYQLDNPANKRFVADFQKEYGRLPTLYAAQGYDAARLIDVAVRDVGGQIENKDLLRRALEAARFESVRGAFRFNVNHFPIQDYYLREIVKDDQGRVTNRLMGKVFENHSDAYAAECKMPS